MSNIEQKQRILGLDILRIISMCGIVGLHMINQGGIIDNITPDCGIRYIIILALLTVFYLSVNTFGILSGYLGIKKTKQKYSRIFELIAILAFYIIAQVVIFYGFNLYNVRQAGVKVFLTNLFPFAIGRYWYITGYVLLFFMMPYLNKIAKSLNRQQYKRLIITLFVFLSVIPSIFLGVDFFKIENGHSPFWLIFLYLVGGYIKLYSIQIKKKKALVFVLLSASFAINYLVRLVTYKSFGSVKLNDYFINYISPLNVFASALLVFLFGSMKKNGNSKTIRFFSNSAFSVYIMHGNMFFVYVIYNFLTWSNDIFILSQVCVVFGCILAIYFIASILDQIRVGVFKIFKVDRMFNAIGRKIEGRIGIDGEE